MQRRVAAQPRQRRRVDRRTADYVAAAVRLDVLDTGNDVEVRAVTSAAFGLLMVQKEAAHVDERVASSLRRRARLVGLAVLAFGEPQRDTEQRPALGVELAVEPEAAFEHRRQVQ